MTGQTPHRTAITAISNAFPCVLTVLDDDGFESDDFIRLTDLNGAMPIPRGMDPLNNYRFRIKVTAANEFTLYHPVTNEKVDSTTYPSYVSGGSCNLIESNFEYNP